MTFPHDEHPDQTPNTAEEQAYDDYLEALIAGYIPEDTPENLTDADATFTAEMLAMIHDTAPDANFAAQLEAQLSAKHAQKQRTSKIILFPGRIRRPLATVAAVMMLLLIVTLTVPPVRTLAQNLIDTLFFRAPSDVQMFETPVQRPVLDPTPTFTIPTPAPPDIDEAQRQVNFPINLPRWLPPGYRLHSVAGYGTYASAFYIHPDHYAVGLTIYPLPYIHPLEVGESAEIIDVQIRDVVGQYVPRGGWVAVTDNDGNTVTYKGEVWDPTVHYQRLRWIRDGLVYILATPISGVSNLTLDDMVRIAESMP